jgi:hypothetical protein
MKIGVIADTHIADETEGIPQEALESFKHVDMVIHAGDLVDLSVIDKLKKVCPNIKAVCGNMDSNAVRAKFPEKDIIEAGSHKIGIMHGYGHPERLVEILKQSFQDKGVDIIVFGHSHNPFNKRIDGILFFNPGSAGDKIFAPYNSYGIIEINGGVEARIERL